MPRQQEAAAWTTGALPDADGWMDVERHPSGQVKHGSGRAVERARVRVLPDARGRLEVRELHLLDLGQPITAERLRAFNLGTIGQMIAMQAIVAEQSGAKPARSRSLKPPASRGYSNDFYERVADSYRSALLVTGRRPVVAIANEAGVPRSTAARWVKEARHRGLLGAAPAPGKAGE